MGSGKTTLANAILKEFNSGVRLRFAQPLYEMHDACRVIMDKYAISYDKSKKDGNLLQLLGTEWGRKHHGDNVWVEALKNAYQGLPKGSIAVVEDCRFKNELEAFRQEPFKVFVRLECDRWSRQTRCSMWRENENHPSEIDLDSYVYEPDKFDLILNTKTTGPEYVAKIVLRHIAAVRAAEVDTLNASEHFVLETQEKS